MNLLVGPVVTPLFAAALCLFLFRSLRGQQIVSGIAVHAVLAWAIQIARVTFSGEILVLRLGGWPSSYGIVYAADMLTGIMLLLAGVVLVLTWWFIVSGATPRKQQIRYFYPLLMILACGVNWAFVTADLFNLFVSFELLLLANYALLVHGGGAHTYRQGYKFVILNVVTSTFFLVGAGLVYGTFGTLNYADLALKVAASEQPHMARTLGTMLMIVFATKAALFPLFFWLPDAYPKAPLGILPLFAGILTKVGVYCLFRVFTLIFDPYFTGWFQDIFFIMAALTMVLGSLAAMSQMTFRHILSYHIISQIGFMIFGLALFTVTGLAAGIFYIVHDVIIKVVLFMITSTIILVKGQDHLRRIGGMIGTHPFLGILFFCGAFSLVGLPPFSGFFGKFALVLAGLSGKEYLYVALLLFSSMITLYNMIKIFSHAFWREPDTIPSEKATAPIAVAAVATALSIAVAVFSGPLMTASGKAAEQLKHPAPYINAIIVDTVHHDSHAEVHR